jgi:SAM-dependent methyltransferase
MLEPWTRLALVPAILPALDGVLARLERGARVADVGCGAGLAILTMAAAFPRSRFVGYDPSRHAIVLADQRREQSGLDNVEFRAAGAEELPSEPEYDLIVTLDCLHDMPRPQAAMGAIRAAIRDDGTWLVKDIRCSPRWQDNARNPVLAMLYGTSVACCMSSALSEPGGAGLGTVGLPPELLEEMTRRNRVVSLTAEPMPAFAVDPAPMIDSVAGALTIPIPMP